MNTKSIINQKNCAVLVDANAFVHRAYHGYASITDKIKNDASVAANYKDFDMQATQYSVLHGIMQAIYDVVKHVDKIEYLYLVFDPIDSINYRKSLFPLYKANRPPTPQELIRQRNEAKQILGDEIGVPIIEVPGFEADDAIGSMAKYYSATHKVAVISPDKDLFQLIDDDVMIVRPRKQNNKKYYEYITSCGVQKYFGVNPNQIPDYLSLVGDSSDNLPGVDGIGQVGASYLLSKYHSIEKIHSVIDDLISIESGYKNYLNIIKQNIDIVLAVKNLATIKTDLCVHDHILASLEKATNVQAKEHYISRLDNLSYKYSIKSHLIKIFK